MDSPYPPQVRWFINRTGHLACCGRAVPDNVLKWLLFMYSSNSQEPWPRAKLSDLATVAVLLAPEKTIPTFVVDCPPYPRTDSRNVSGHAIPFWAFNNRSKNLPVWFAIRRYHGSKDIFNDLSLCVWAPLTFPPSYSSFFVTFEFYSSVSDPVFFYS